MHSLLQSILPTGITIVLWCVCAAAAVIVQPSQNNETQPLPDSPPAPFTVVVRTIPIIKQLPFEERWRDPAPQTMPFIISLADQYQQVSLQLKPDQQASQPAERPDLVCGSKGRRYFHIGRILSWRCNHLIKAPLRAAQPARRL
jgi:hypothetical protein